MKDSFLFLSFIFFRCVIHFWIVLFCIYSLGSLQKGLCSLTFWSTSALPVRTAVSPVLGTYLTFQNWSFGSPVALLLSGAWKLGSQRRSVVVVSADGSTSCLAPVANRSRLRHCSVTSAFEGICVWMKYSPSCCSSKVRNGATHKMLCLFFF